MKTPSWWQWPYGFRLWLFGWLVVVVLIIGLLVRLA
jgi:hypothetical protein